VLYTSSRVEERSVKPPNWFEELPVASPPVDRWQISLRPLSITVAEDEEESWQPRILLIVESGTGAVLGHRLLEPEADPDLVLDLLLSTMCSPATGDPRRPSAVQTDTEQLVPFLKEMSAQLHITVEQLPDLPELSYALHTFEEFVNLKPSLYLEEEGADPEQVAAFFAAAAAFYRAAPWTRISDSEPITLYADCWEDAKYAVVMGQGEIAHGLALYDDPEDLEDLYLDDTMDPSEIACTAVTFERKDELTDDQWEEIESQRWELASEEAVPLALRTDALAPPRLPSMEGLRDLTLALSLIPELVKTLPEAEESRESGEPQTWEKEVQGRKHEGLWGYGIFYLEEEPNLSLSIEE
jgi:hypothetical protein